MTFLVKCDHCGKVQEAQDYDQTQPTNPKDDETGERWYSRRNPDTKKTEHACCKEHIKDGLIMPI